MLFVDCFSVDLAVMCLSSNLMFVCGFIVFTKDKALITQPGVIIHLNEKC